MITLQNADAALKDYYLDAVSSQLNGAISPFFNAIEKTADNVYGKDVTLAIVKGSMANVVAGDEDGALPSPYSNRYYSVTVPLKNIYGTIEISDKAVRASRDSSGAFVNLLNAEMEGLISSAKANFSRMLFGDGNGLLATVVAQTSTTAVKVDSARKYFVGLKVDFYEDSDVIASGITIKDVNLTNNTVTLDKTIASGTLLSGNTMCVSGSYGKELCGLAGIFDGKTLYGYTKANDYYFAPYTASVKSADLKESDLVSAIDLLEAQYDSKVNMILCSFSTRKKIAELMADSRRIINTTDVAAGYSAIYVNGVEVHADKFCPDNRIYFVNSEDFSLNQLCDWEWLEDEDGKILKQVAGKAAYSATLVKYAELICKKPCGQGLISLT